MDHVFIQNVGRKLVTGAVVQIHFPVFSLLTILAVDVVCIQYGKELLKTHSAELKTTVLFSLFSCCTATYSTLLVAAAVNVLMGTGLSSIQFCTRQTDQLDAFRLGRKV